jgi:hypothetical protein
MVTQEEGEEFTTTPSTGSTTLASCLENIHTDTEMKERCIVEHH